MKKFKAFLNVLSWALSFFIFLSAASLVVSMLLGFKVFCIKTASMEPEYPVGALVLVKPTPFSELAGGDVISFNAGGAIVTHRVTDIDSRKMLLYTKGDNNNTQDFAPVAYDNVIGRVVFCVKYVGYPVLFAQTKPGKIILIDLIAILLLARIIFFFLSRRESEEEPEEQS